MNNKRFWISTVAVWVGLMVANWIFHGVWLVSLYRETAQFWRPENEMGQWIWVIMVGNFAFAWAFTWIFSKGISNANPWMQAFRYAWAIILVSQVPHLATQWAVNPYPFELIAKWFVAGALTAMLCAFIVTWTYLPKTHWQHAH